MYAQLNLSSYIIIIALNRLSAVSGYLALAWSGPHLQFMSSLQRATKHYNNYAISIILLLAYRLDHHGVIKVADFGLAEDVYTTGYFRENDGGVKLPFKWMAPESLTDSVFTEKTDVVS